MNDTRHHRVTWNRSLRSYTCQLKRSHKPSVLEALTFEKCHSASVLCATDHNNLVLEINRAGTLGVKICLIQSQFLNFSQILIENVRMLLTYHQNSVKSLAIVVQRPRISLGKKLVNVFKGDRYQISSKSSNSNIFSLQKVQLLIFSSVFGISTVTVSTTVTGLVMPKPLWS